MVETVNEGKKGGQKRQKLVNVVFEWLLSAFYFKPFFNVFGRNFEDETFQKFRPEICQKSSWIQLHILCEIYYILTSVPTPRIKEFLLGNDTRLCIFPPFPCDVIRGLRWSPCPSDSWVVRWITWLNSF